MLDPKCFRANLIETANLLKKRGLNLDVDLIKNLEEQRKIVQIDTQELQNQRNQYSKEIGMAKAKGLDANESMRKVSIIGEELIIKQDTLEEILVKLDDIYHRVPNIPHQSVPEGLSEEDNVEIRRFGQPKEFNFTPKDHTELGLQLGMMNFEEAAKITGARFVVLYDKLAKLQRVLGDLMLDIHTQEHNYKEVYVPNMVNDASLFGTGNLPKFGEDLFKLEGDFKYSLIPTAEVPITNLLRDKIISEDQLPLKYVARTPCFRSEAGSYGKDMHGMIRQHQFEKVEIVCFARPQDSYKLHEELTLHAEKILQKLGLPYRTVTLCAGDMGFSAAKTYDLEVWLPSQNKYREISSCSNYEDFQTRRMQARFRSKETGKIELLHTLNGSGLAVGRTLVAIMENYQDADGHIYLPEVLWERMGCRVI